MGSKPKKPKAVKPAPKPDPATVAVSIDDSAKRQAELERRKRGGFYRSFRRRNSATSSTPGGENQQVG